MMMPFDRLEPYDGKLSRTVLRGGAGSNVSLLPDIRDEKDALRLVNNLIQATTPKNSHESDPFWVKSETALLQAIILMLWQEAPEYEQNFSMVMRVLEYADTKEDDDEYVSPLDLLFQAIEREKSDSVAVRQYKVFKLATGDICSKRLVNSLIFR